MGLKRWSYRSSALTLSTSGLSASGPRSVERLPATIPYGARPVAAPVFLVLETTRGTMTVELYPALAPVHVAHVLDCARRGVYDGLTWHRVVPDFVIQGGCPRGDGSGNARMRGWFRLLDDESLDTLALVLVVDAFPPTSSTTPGRWSSR